MLHSFSNAQAQTTAPQSRLTICDSEKKETLGIVGVYNHLYGKRLLFAGQSSDIETDPKIAGKIFAIDIFNETANFAIRRVDAKDQSKKCLFTFGLMSVPTHTLTLHPQYSWMRLLNKKSLDTVKAHMECKENYAMQASMSLLFGETAKWQGHMLDGEFIMLLTNDITRAFSLLFEKDDKMCVGIIGTGVFLQPWHAQRPKIGRYEARIGKSTQLGQQ